MKLKNQLLRSRIHPGKFIFKLCSSPILHTITYCHEIIDKSNYAAQWTITNMFWRRCFGGDGAAANDDDDDDDEDDEDDDEYKYDDSISTSITTAAGDGNNVDYDKKKKIYIVMK